MNIMESLGFTKKGAARPSEPVTAAPAEVREMIEFSDKTPRAEGETRIFNLIILDESGSMGSIRSEALTGVNETIQTIRSAQQEHPDDHQMLCFVTFDQSSHDRPDVRLIIDNEKIENVQDVKPEQYRPNGMTPLYDAMGKSVNALRKLVREGDHVLVTVVTDGFENASSRYSAGQIKEMVDGLSAQGWVFTYIGANQDSETTAGRLGIRNTMDFQASKTGTEMMWNKMRSSHRQYFKKVRAMKEGMSFDLQDDFFSEKEALMRVTPDHVDRLGENQVFVFGSNEAGHHDGGAARQAFERFGAVYGQGRGLQGQSYAIPTMGSLESLERDVEEFIRFADAHPEMTFLVTRIGCGIAGYTDAQIAPMFASAVGLSNVHLPAEFWKVLIFKHGR